jgi:hypothetical protein
MIAFALSKNRRVSSVSATTNRVTMTEWANCTASRTGPEKTSSHSGASSPKSASAASQRPPSSRIAEIPTTVDVELADALLGVLQHLWLLNTSDQIDIERDIDVHIIMCIVQRCKRPTVFGSAVSIFGRVFPKREHTTYV